MAEIEQKAGSMLTENQVERLPVRPDWLAERAGIKVSQKPLEGIKQGDYDGNVISIDVNLGPRQKRYVTAHELGHAVLEHKGRNACDTAASQTTEEREADWFAKALLLPRGSLGDAVERYRGKQVTAFQNLVEFVSSIFEVEERIAYERLKECGHL